ncbi:MAG: PLDc N-terminal domain-containing protein [Desulfatibacillaceae bacterium]
MSTGMFVVIAGALFFVITCLAILDISGRVFKPEWMAWTWLAVVVFLPFVGCVLYFVFGRRRSRKPDRGETRE